MTIANVTKRDVFLLSINRLDDQRARMVRLACVHSREVRGWLNDITSDPEQIYAEAIRDYLATVTTQKLEATEQKIVKAFADQRAQDDDYFTISPGSNPADSNSASTKATSTSEPSSNEVSDGIPIVREQLAPSRI